MKNALVNFKNNLFNFVKSHKFGTVAVTIILVLSIFSGVLLTNLVKLNTVNENDITQSSDDYSNTNNDSNINAGNNGSNANAGNNGSNANAGNNGSNVDTDKINSSIITENTIVKSSDLSIDYLVNYVADISNSKYLAIKNGEVNNSTTLLGSYSTKNHANALLLLNTPKVKLLDNSKKIKKNFLVKSEDSGFKKIDFKNNKKVLSQDNLPMQINKLYIDNANDLIYIQFIPILEKSQNVKYIDKNGQTKELYIDVRPQNLNYNNGVSDYDKINYFSNDLCQSFIINKQNCKIYKIDNISIKSISNGLIKAEDGFVYDVKIDNGALKFVPLFTNKTITPTEYFKDKYGNNFIKNNTVNYLDNKTNTLFYTDGYYKTAENIVIKIDAIKKYDSANQVNHVKVTNVKKIVSNLIEAEIELNDSFDFYSQRIYGEYYDGWEKIEKIENGTLYIYGAAVSSKVLFAQFDIKTQTFKTFYIQGNYIYPVNYNTIIRFDGEKNKTGNLYVWQVDFSNKSIFATNHSGVTYWYNKHDKYNLLLEDCLWNYKFISNEECQWNNFSKNTLNSTQTYTVTVKNNTCSLIKIEDYISSINNPTILQPLN